MKIACRNIDRLANCSIRPEGLPREDLYQLYKCLDKDGPVSYQITNALLERKGARIVLITGAADQENFPNGENDGPLGTVALARALDLLGYKCVIYTEKPNVLGIVEISKLIGCQVPVKELDMEPGDQYKEIAKKFDILIAIEKQGMNAKGIQHSVTGRSRVGERAKVDYIVEDMNDQGKLTIGIGDGGNEIGFGNVYDEARELIKMGKKCECGCGGGIITTAKTTFLYPVAISNWGAYSLCASLAIATKRQDLIVTPLEEHEMLKHSIKLELVDGGTGKAYYALDGISGEASVGFVTILKEVVDITGTVNKRHF